MKHPSFLNAITQPYPHRTSLHSHMQSTAYHYNSILNAKSQINNTTPNQKICLDILNNKRAKNLNKQRKSQNQKLLKSLIHIQRNYSLYGTKNYTELSSHSNKNSFYQTKRNSLDSKLDPFNKTKTLKNPFLQNMEKLKISQENLKLFEKISTAQSSFANKKQMKQWNNKIKYLGSFLQSSRQKQSTQSIKNQFFSTFIKMRESNNFQSNTIRLQPKSLIINPQLRTMSNSKRINNEPNQICMKESFRIKKEKKKSRKLRRMQTEGGQSEGRQIKCYTENQQTNG